MLFAGRKNIDMLNGTLWDKILMFAIPLALTGILQQCFTAADVAVVGQFAGEAAMAAVGSNTPVVGLFVNLFVGVSLGTNVVISQLTGRGDMRRIRQAVHTSLLLAMAGGVILTVVGELAAAPLLRLLDVPDEVFPMALSYLRIYILGLPVIFLYNFEAAIYRSQGETGKPLIALAVSGVINVLLNLFFVVVLKRAADGVAIATVLANLISSAMLFVMLMREPGAIRVHPEELKIEPVLLKNILKIGIPSGLQSCVFSLSNICVQSAINSLGTIVIAASAAAFNIEIFSFFIINSFGQACTTFVGQNYGAGREDRCIRTLRCSLLLDALFTVVSCTLILVFATPLLSLFNGNPEVIRLGTIRLRYLFSAYIFSLFIENFSGYLRGYGMSAIPAMTALVSVCGVRILWVFTIFRHYPDFPMLMTVYPVSLGINALCLGISSLVFAKKRGRTKSTSFCNL